MQDSQSLIQQVAQEIAASQSNSTTAAGQADSARSGAHAGQERPAPGEAHIDAINQVFALFRINYHNQYYSAFKDNELLNQARRLWLNSLAQFSPETILRGARKVIEESEYLPTLNRMIRACQGEPEAGPGEAARDGSADAASGAGDQGDHPGHSIRIERCELAHAVLWCFM